MKIQPLNARVLVKPQEQKEKKAGSIFIPDTNTDKPVEGTIMEVPAEGIEHIAVGDRVIYKKDAGEEISADNETLLLIEAADLLAKIVDTDAIPA